MFDKKFKGLDKSKEIRMLSLLDVHPGCAVTIHDSKTHPLSTCLGHWRIQCSQYHTTPPPKCKSDEEESLAGDKVAEINTKPPTSMSRLMAQKRKELFLCSVKLNWIMMPLLKHRQQKPMITMRRRSQCRAPHTFKVC